MKEEYLLSRKKERRKIIILGLIVVLILLISLCIGRYFISLENLFLAFRGKCADVKVNQVLFKVRLPRVLSAAVVGASLAISGTAYQGMFKNPLVAPDLLGASAGAGFGASVAILLSLGLVGVKMYAFGFGLLAVSVTWFISRTIGRGDDSYFLLILGGILVSSVFQALISAIKYLADPQDQLPAITFWLMGSLSKVSYRDVVILVIPFVIGSVILCMFSNQLNIMAIGEEEAKTMGINTRLVQAVVVIAATILTSFAVSLCGVIGWVGLIIPHLTRMFIGPNFKVLMPASALMGGIYLLLIDDISRTLWSVEIPLGILTALVGAPFFVYLLAAQKKGW
jgi:iron complex transport system permease protein